MASPQRIGIQHLPALDGLRGLAVIGVLLFHDDRLRGGYLGVDLFFVLSGFLITSLLLAEHGKTGTIDLRAFWIRRARRLFPAALALLVLVSLYARIFADPAELARIRADGLATLGYVANWRAIVAGRSYWELFAAPSPLEHTWSLAIEEQFYVLWPLIALLVLRLARGSARALLGASALLGAASIAAMWLVYWPENPSRAYLGTDTRGAAILAGAALACARSLRPGPLTDRAVRGLDAAGLAAAAGLTAAWILLDGKSPFLYRGGFWLTEIAVLVLIACAAEDRRSLVARALSWKPLAGAGLISYGLYLYHWPLFVVLTAERTGVEGPRLTALRLTATVAIALVSYRFLEQPIRKRGLPVGRPLLVVPAAIFAVALALLSSTAARPLPPEAAAPPTPPGAPPGPPPLALSALPAAGAVPAGTLRVLVLGDSVAIALGERLRAVQEGSGSVVAERGVGDCSILEGTLPTRSLTNTPHEGGDCASRWKSDAAELRPDVTIVILGGGFFAPVEVGGKWQRPCEPGWGRAYGGELRRELASLRPDGGRVVLLLSPYPVGTWTGAAPKERVDCFNATLREAASGVEGVRVVDLPAELCPGGECRLKSGGAPIRPDGIHFGGPGAEGIARWVLARVR
ncbi:MAG: acyltransferase [Polyangiaceae bacterium]|nr:acyltransferase [Polyangiaceae bacterium]